MKTSRQGWIGLQRRKGAEFRQWLSESQALQTGFSVLTKSLHALLEHRVRTKEDVRNVWDAVPAVMGKCDHPSTYRMPGAADGAGRSTVGLPAEPGRVGQAQGGPHHTGERRA